MTDDEQTSGLLALLAWWRDAGVGDALDDEAIDWSAHGDVAPGAGFVWPERAVPAASPPDARGQAGRGEAPGLRTGRPEVSRPIAAPNAGSLPGRRPQSRPSPMQPSERGADAPPAPRREAAAVVAARDAARSARTLDELEALLRVFDGCPLKANAKNLCFYRGSPVARLMVIGEAPGREEDIAGKPFVGRSGQLLDLMLAAIGLTEADVHIANVVYWRPPGNRPPTPEEAQACKPFVDRQIELVAPDCLLTLGGPATKAILDTPDGILKLRGRWREARFGNHSVRVMPTLHPAYLLRQPEAKRQAWRDLLQMKTALDGQTEGTKS
jgi:DNA polymerase